MLTTQSFKDLAERAWRSTRLFSLVLIVIALAVGTQLRFHRLARFDMSGDETASRSAAAAPTVQQVVNIEQWGDPGKLALYDLMLHEWIKLVGDSLFAMRAISAGLGTIAIVLVFVAVREVYRSLAQDPDSGIGELAGTFAALLYATNVEMVLSDRIVRMYPLMMCAELLQIACFVRAQRRDRLLDYIGVATFTAVMIATNFTSIFLILAEGLWLGWLLLSAGEYSRWLAVFRSACALAAGVAMLTPWLPRALASSWRAVKGGVIDWIALQPISWPYTTLRNSTDNSILFRVFVALAALGVRQQWRSARPVMEFLAVWTTGPILLTRNHPDDDPVDGLQVIGFPRSRQWLQAPHTSARHSTQSYEPRDPASVVADTRCFSTRSEGEI